MRELLLVRHGKSSWDSGAASDFDRPLAKRGRREAPAMGAWLAARGIVPDRILTSPARRALDTAERLRDGLGAAELDLETDERIYGGGMRALVGVLEERGGAEAASVMLVGHNPALDELVLWIASAPPPYAASGKLMTTCAVAHVTPLEPPLLLGPRAGRIEGIYRPREVL